MNLQEIMFIISFIFFYFYIFVYLELFTRKEYRLDRLRAHIEDFGLRELFWPSELRRPRLLHPRNILMILFSFFTFFISFSFVRHDLWSSIIFLFLSPFIALSFALIGLFMTSIPVSIYRQIIIQLASRRIARYKPTVIGVTGSYGKSITKSYIAKVLSSRYKVVETPSNTNTDIGIALTILKQINTYDLIFVVEIGAYRMGEVERVCHIVRPFIAIITAFGTQHSAIFGGRANIIKAKCELAQAVDPKGHVYIPDKFLAEIPDDILASIPAPVSKYKYISDSPSDQAIQACTCVARHMGLTYDGIQKEVESLPKPANQKFTRTSKGFEILLSTYSTNTQAFLSHINLLAKTKNPKKIIITPGIIELGKDKKGEYEEIARAIPVGTQIFTTDPYLSEICSTNDKVAVTLDRSQKRLFSKVKSVLHADCAVLIEGRFRKIFVDATTK